MAAGANDLVTLAQAQSWLGIAAGADDVNLQLAVSAYSQAIADWCSRQFVAANFTEFYDGQNTTRILLRQYPIISVSSLVVNGVAKTQAATWAGPGYLFSGRNLDLIGDGFWRGSQNVVVTYRAGYEAGMIPADLQMACLEWLKVSYLARQRDPNLISQRAGDHEKKYEPGGAATLLNQASAPMPANVFAVLSQYRNNIPV